MNMITEDNNTVPENMQEQKQPIVVFDEGDNPFDIPEEKETFSYSDLYDKLAFADELILVINEADLKRLKNGLSVAKNAALSKLKEVGMEDDGKKLKYIHIPASSTNPVPKGQLMIKIMLEAPKVGIVVHQIIIPEKDI